MSSTTQQSPLLSRAFKPSAWLANIDFIKRLICSRHLLMVLMSEAGGGKSTFVDLMRFKLEPEIQTVLIDGDSSPETVIAALSDVLGVPVADVASTQSAEEKISYLFSHSIKRKYPLLIVLEAAHTLPFAFLNALLLPYHEMGQHKGVAMCWVADTQFTAVLHRFEQAKCKQFIHTIEPGPLTEIEARTYLLKALQGYAWSARWLSAERIQMFYQMTQGQIVSMNQQIEQWVMEQTSTASRWTGLRSAAQSRTAWLLCSVLGLGICLHAWTLRHSAAVQLAQAPTVALKSEIAPWYHHAQRAIISPPPLQEFADVIEDTNTSLQARDLSLVDKVVVIPEVGQHDSTSRNG